MERQLALVLIAILAASIVSVAGVVTTAPTADAATKTPTKIEITKGPHTPDGRTWAKRGEQFSITGTLKTNTGTPLGAKTVYAVWTRLNDKGQCIKKYDWAAAKSYCIEGATKKVTTQSDGSFEIFDSCKEVNSYRYFVRFNGDKQYGFTTTPDMYIRIGLTKVYFNAVPQNPKPNQVYQLGGKVTNQDNEGIPHVQVNVYKQTWDKSTLYGKAPGWSVKGTQTNERGEYVLNDRATSNAVSYHYAKFPGDTQYFSSKSPQIRVATKT